MKFKILLNTFLGLFLIPFILILDLVFPHSFFNEYISRFFLLLFYAEILYRLFFKERKFLVDYVDETDLITFVYLNQFARTKRISVAKQEVQRVELEKKRKFWRPFDILTLSKKHNSLKFEFKEERLRKLSDYLPN